MKFEVAVMVLCLTLVSEAQERVEVSFQLIDGWAMVLDGTLGGLHHQKMLIDTGAVPSAISIRVAKRLGLLGSVQELSLMNRSIAVERVRVPEVQLGVVAVAALDMVAMDLGRIERALGTRIDAVVGLDLLGMQNFSLDYRRKKLVFGTTPDAARAIAFQIKHEAGGTYILIPLDSSEDSAAARSNFAFTVKISISTLVARTAWRKSRCSRSMWDRCFGTSRRLLSGQPPSAISGTLTAC